MSVSAREVDTIRYFYSITFQDAVEKISDNLSLTSKPQEVCAGRVSPTPHEQTEMITGSLLMAKHRPPENYLVYFSNVFFSRLQNVSP